MTFNSLYCYSYRRSTYSVGGGVKIRRAMSYTVLSITMKSLFRIIRCEVSVNRIANCTARFTQVSLPRMSWHGNSISNQPSSVTEHIPASVGWCSLQNILPPYCDNESHRSKGQFNWAEITGPRDHMHSLPGQYHKTFISSLWTRKADATNGHELISSWVRKDSKRHNDPFGAIEHNEDSHESHTR
jgi:hypothetical protein